MVEKSSLICWRLFSMTLILAGITEVILQKRPLELSKWGEFDALQKDSTRVYSLKPYGNFLTTLQQLWLYF